MAMIDTAGLEARSKRLRSLLAQEEILVLPGVVNPWAARLAAQAGFDAIFATGAGIANVDFGAPDIGLIGLAEMTEAVRRIGRSIDVPLVADGDTGYGGAVHVYHTVELYRDAGAAGITIEDQVTPKRCGHFDGKRVVPLPEMLEKIVAFREARGTASTVLIARTDAIAVEGFTKAIERASAYIEAGADAIFVEAPTDDQQLKAIPELLTAPTVVNMVEGGQTPAHSAGEFQDMGYAAVIFANMAMRVAGAAVRAAFETLRREGGTEGLADAMLSWEDRQSLARLPHWLEIEQAVVARSRTDQPSGAREGGDGPSGRSASRVNGEGT